MTVDTQLIAKITGFSSSELCAELMRHAANVSSDLAIVEVGVYYGRSLCHIALGAYHGNGAHVWGVDPWDLPGQRYSTGWLNKPGFAHRKNFTKTETRVVAERNVRESGLSDHITLMREFSSNAGQRWTGPKIGMLFIDGDHREDAIVLDIESWRSHLIPGAIVAFDDYDRQSHPDVPRVVDHYVSTGVLQSPRLVAGRLMVTEYAS